MGSVRSFTLEKLVIGMLCSRPAIASRVEDELQAQFGPVDYRSERIPFTFTNYYDSEMGRPIDRTFYSFEELVNPEALAAAKLFTNRMEQRFASEERRRVNLDPGLLSLQRLVLASTKDNGRRVPLRDGIYAEITLIYVDGGFRPLQWTYPDYSTDVYHQVFSRIRNRYREQLRRLKG